MWQTDWAQRTGGPTSLQSPDPSSIRREDLLSVYVLHWQEHCLECAVPQCYQVCPLYVRRRDGNCSRFRDGIVPNRNYDGLYPYGAEIRFRKWGKLQAEFGRFGALSPGLHRTLDSADRALLAGIQPLAHLFRTLSPRYLLSLRYDGLRRRFCRAVSHQRRPAPDEFVMEVWNFQPDPVRIIVECEQPGPRFRTSLELQTGRTLHRIPFEDLSIDLGASAPIGRIKVFPENDAEAHLAFTWLDFVQYAQDRRPLPLNVDPGDVPAAAAVASRPPDSVPAQVPASRPAEKVKCVVWDLDNTVWDGILGDQDPAALVLRSGLRDLMLALDQRGILLGVCSKNDHEFAFRVLERLEIADLLLSPRINWRPKSDNLLEIAEELNIGIDTLALIDDSPFERAEVSGRLPMVRVYSDSDVPDLLSRPEFDVPVTEESRRRREMYQVESRRKRAASSHHNDYAGFLRSCNMVARVFSPSEPSHVERSLELLLRTNQLNLSARRYNRAEFDRLLSDPSYLSVCTSCVDRFGEYGITGFASFQRVDDRLMLVDYVMSCRVAQKKLENAWFRWAVNMAVSMGDSRIFANYVRTSRNSVLLAALTEVGFAPREVHESGSLLELDSAWPIPDSDLVDLKSDLSRRPHSPHWNTPVTTGTQS